jgi:hypothetical protein
MAEGLPSTPTSAVKPLFVMLMTPGRMRSKRLESSTVGPCLRARVVPAGSSQARTLSLATTTRTAGSPSPLLARTTTGRPDCLAAEYTSLRLTAGLTLPPSARASAANAAPGSVTAG